MNKPSQSVSKEFEIWSKSFWFSLDGPKDKMYQEFRDQKYHLCGSLASYQAFLKISDWWLTHCQRWMLQTKLIQGTAVWFLSFLFPFAQIQVCRNSPGNVIVKSKTVLLSNDLCSVLNPIDVVVGTDALWKDCPTITRLLQN